MAASVLALIFLLLGCGTARETPAPAVPEEPEVAEEGADRILVSGYHPWWLQGAWREYDTSLYDEIYFFSVEIDSSGGIVERNGWPDRWFAMQQALTNAGIRVTPVVTLFSQSAFEQLFAEPTTSDHLMETLLELLRDSPAVGGLQLDFEMYQPVPAPVRSNFSAFVRRLSGQMATVRPNLSLSLYMLAYDQSDVFDEAAIAAHADYLVIQGYDLHGRNEDLTGPVAALTGWGDRNWQSVVQRFRSLGIPPSKLVVGTPFYGYEWPAESAEPGARTRGSGRTISYARVDTIYLSEGPPSALERVERYGLERDPDSGSPYYTFEDSTGWRQGWFEDAQSLRGKFEWIAEEGLRGIAVFPPAYSTEEIDALMREYFEPVAP